MGIERTPPLGTAGSVPLAARAEPVAAVDAGRPVSGVGDGFATFYAAAAPVLRRLAVARTGDWSAAEDIVQDVLADAARRWDRIGRYDQPLVWARRAVLNRSVSRWRRRGRERRALERLAHRAPTAVSDDPVGEPVAASLSDAPLWDAVRALPTRQLQVVLLLWFEELSVPEVAATLGCGPETVRTHWRRARTRLSQTLGVPEGTEAEADREPGDADRDGPDRVGTDHVGTGNPDPDPDPDPDPEEER